MKFYHTNINILLEDSSVICDTKFARQKIHYVLIIYFFNEKKVLCQESITFSKNSFEILMFQIQDFCTFYIRLFLDHHLTLIGLGFLRRIFSEGREAHLTIHSYFKKN